jgi:two-component system cell cycle response regulator
VVDDDGTSRKLIARLLENAGLAVLQARDGAEGALVAMRERPSVVVTDLEMPLMDGYQLARLLKTDPSTRDLPVLILTGHDAGASRFWGLSTGADRFLTKGCPPGELLAAVESLLATAPLTPAAAGLPPGGPLDVLARVAHQLDLALLESTLAATLLGHGMQEHGLADTARALLATLQRVSGARLVVLALAEERSSVWLHRAAGIDGAEVEGFVASLLAWGEELPSLGGSPELLGEGGEAPERGKGELFVLELPLHGARGRLGLAARSTRDFDSTWTLIERMAGPLRLLLDNARLAERLDLLSRTDGLTGILNHRTIVAVLEEEFERARRYRHPLAIVLCDLDHFKAVNDTFGHMAGDLALASVAASLKSGIRRVDAVGRYGGEEFLMVLPETELAAGRRAAQRLCDDLAALSLDLPDGGKLSLTASFGVATADEIGAQETAAALVGLADRRLYDAKLEGRNRVVP